MNVTIESFSFSHPSVSLQMDGIFTPQVAMLKAQLPPLWRQGLQIRGPKPIPKQPTKKAKTR